MRFADPFHESNLPSPPEPVMGEPRTQGAGNRHAPPPSPESKGPQVAEQKPQASNPEAEGQRREMTLRIDESDMTSAYCNTFRTDGSIEEVILDFGMNRLVPGRSNEMLFKVRNQVILNWRNTKRLALTLANLVRQHEERFGEIDIKQTRDGQQSQAG